MSQTATPAPPKDAKSEATTCPSCGSTEPWGFSSWCPSCGFYPKLQTRVEAPPAPVEESEQVAGLTDVLPPWTWLMGAGMLGVIALSFWARLTIEANSSTRLLWAVLQMLVGAITFSVGHATAYFIAIAKTDKIGPFDAFMSPMAVWRPTFVQLPKGASRVCLAAWGATAVLAALLIVDGIPWASLFDGTAKKKAAPSLLHSVVKEARKERESEAASMEEAMNQFVGDAEEGNAAAAGAAGENAAGEKTAEELEKAKAEKERAEKLAKSEQVDCVIFGYTPEGKDDFGMLLLATIVKGRLTFVTSLTAESLPLETRRELITKLKTLHRNRPLVKTTLDAQWVQPTLMMRVRHWGWTRDKKLKNAEFSETLADVKSER